MKRKILIALLTVAAALGCALAFSACADGADGKDGVDGINGVDGEDGTDGKDGVGIERVEISRDGNLVIFYTDGKSEDIGKPPVCNHSYSDWNDGLSASCTSMGYKTRTCSKCGYTDYSFIQASEHVFGEYAQAVAPDCTHTGLKIASCSVCGLAKTQTVSALGHDMITVPARAATCTQAGWAEYESCSRCDYSTCEQIPAKGHTPSLGAGGNQPLVCKDCGEAIVSQTLDSYLSSFNSTYGYEYLGTLEKDGLQELYSAIDTEVKRFHVNGADGGDIEVGYSGLGLTMDEAVKVWKTYRDDNPLYYWMTGKLTYTVESLFIDVDDDYSGGEARTAQNAALDGKILALKAKYGGESSAYMLALAYHDEIINSVNYAYSSGDTPENANWAHSICGVLDGRGAVCEGYAKTFQLLLNVSGVNNVFVTGKSLKQAHAWNLVEIENGKWYWYDLTWDDTPNNYWGIQYNYLCATDESFLTNHTVSQSGGTGADFLYDLPARALSEFEIGYMGSEFTSENLKYRVSGYNTVSMIEAHKDGAVVIPETVPYSGRVYTVAAVGADGKSPFCYVVRDGSSDVNDYYEVTSVSIPQTVIFIDEGPFNGARSLERITVDENNPVFRAVDGVLFNKSLYTLIAYPASKAGAAYAIPDETAVTAAHAFNGLQYLETLTLGKSFRVDGFLKFNGVKFPDSEADLKRVINVLSGEIAYIVWSLKGEKRIIVHEENEYYKVEDNLLLNAEGSVVLAGLGNCGHYDIPDGVEQIGSSAFWNNLNLTGITFPDSLELIGSYVFANCFNLERVHIPANVRYIKDAFGACSNMEEITVDENNLYFTAVGGILYNKALTEIVHVPKALSGDVVLPDGITRIEEYAFNGCSGVKSITVPSGLTYIGYGALVYCDGLESIRFGGTAEQWNAVEKGGAWNAGTGNYTVYCTDGNINKELN